MLIAFELSGEHDTLPASEAIACLESLHADFKIHLRLDGCLVIELKDEASRTAETLSKRLSMTHHIMVVLGIGGAAEEDILDTVRKADIRFEGTYSIRVRRIKDYSKVNTESMERRIGGIFYQKGARADLKNPRMAFRILLTEGRSIFGYIAASIDRGAF